MGSNPIASYRSGALQNNDKASKHGFFAYANVVLYSLKTFSRICHTAKRHYDDDISDAIMTLEPASPGEHCSLLYNVFHYRHDIGLILTPYHAHSGTRLWNSTWYNSEDQVKLPFT